MDFIYCEYLYIENATVSTPATGNSNLNTYKRNMTAIVLIIWNYYISISISIRISLWLKHQLIDLVYDMRLQYFAL